MRLLTRLASAVVPVLAVAGIMVSAAAPAQAATGCGTGATKSYPGAITLANTACADQTVLSGGLVKITGRGAFNVTVPKQSTITSCTSSVYLYVDGAMVDFHGQSCTAQARAGTVSTNTLPSRNVEAGSSVRVTCFFEVSYAGTVYRSNLAGYNAR